MKGTNVQLCILQYRTLLLMESCASFEDDALYAQSETTVTDGECSKRCTAPRLPALDPVECAVLRKFATESASCEMTRSMRTP